MGLLACGFAWFGRHPPRAVAAWLLALICAVHTPAFADDAGPVSVSVSFAALDKERFRALGGVGLERAVVARLVQDGFAVVNELARADVALTFGSPEPGKLMLMARGRVRVLRDEVVLGEGLEKFVFEAAQASSLLVASVGPQAASAPAPAAQPWLPPNVGGPASRMPILASHEQGAFTRPPKPPRKDKELGIGSVGVAAGVSSSSSFTTGVLMANARVGRTWGLATHAHAWWRTEADSYRASEIQLAFGPSWRTKMGRGDLTLGASFGMRQHRFVTDARNIWQLRFAGVLPVEARWPLGVRLMASTSVALAFSTHAQTHLVEDQTWQHDAAAIHAALGLSFKFQSHPPRLPARD